MTNSLFPTELQKHRKGALAVILPHEGPGLPYVRYGYLSDDGEPTHMRSGWADTQHPSVERAEMELKQGGTLRVYITVHEEYLYVCFRRRWVRSSERPYPIDTVCSVFIVPEDSPLVGKHALVKTASDMEDPEFKYSAEKRDFYRFFYQSEISKDVPFLESCLSAIKVKPLTVKGLGAQWVDPLWRIYVEPVRDEDWAQRVTNFILKHRFRYPESISEPLRHALRRGVYDRIASTYLWPPSE